MKDVTKIAIKKVFGKIGRGLLGTFYMATGIGAIGGAAVVAGTPPAMLTLGVLATGLGMRMGGKKEPKAPKSAVPAQPVKTSLMRTAGFAKAAFFGAALATGAYKVDNYIRKPATAAAPATHTCDAQGQNCVPVP